MRGVSITGQQHKIPVIHRIELSSSFYLCIRLHRLLDAYTDGNKREWLKRRERKEKYRMRGLNPRPIACEAIVITTTPTRHYEQVFCYRSQLTVYRLLTSHPPFTRARAKRIAGIIGSSDVTPGVNERNKAQMQIMFPSTGHKSYSYRAQSRTARQRSFHPPE